MPNLYVIEEDQEYEDEVFTMNYYVTAPNIREALAKWKSYVASTINDDVRGAGGEPDTLPSDVNDPLSITLVAVEPELVL